VRRLLFLKNRYLLPWRWIALFTLFVNPLFAEGESEGRSIMDKVISQHEFYPYVFEEQTMVLIDNSDNRNVRKLRRFSRVEGDGTVKYLLVFDNPAEIRGVVLLAVWEHSGNVQGEVYLPAFGDKMISASNYGGSSPFLDTDFAVADFTLGNLSDFIYKRQSDVKINKLDCFVVDALPETNEIEQKTGYSQRRHYIRQDNFFLVRTDYFDRRGRFFKKQTWHDLRKVGGNIWRANMVLMENFKTKHKTLIKINRRVFSRDYVPAEMFTPDWLFKGKHLRNNEMPIFKNSLDSAEKNLDKFEDTP